MKFLSWCNRFFLNSTSQQQNDTPHIKYFHTQTVSWIVQFNKSTAKKTPIYEIFESMKIIFSSIQQVNSKLTQPHIQKLSAE